MLKSDLKKLKKAHPRTKFGGRNLEEDILCLEAGTSLSMTAKDVSK